MSLEVGVGLFVLVALVVAAFLAMAETSLNRIDRYRAQALVDEKRRGAHALLAIVDDKERFAGYLNSVLLLLLATQISTATAVAYILLNHFDGPLFILAVVIEVFIIYVWAEAMPKTWAIQHAERVALFCSPIIAGMSRYIPMRFVTRPLIWFSNVMLPGKGLRQGPFVYEQQILALADTAAKEQAIQSEEHRLIHSVIEFRTTIAREVMVPRTDMVTVADAATCGEAIELAMDKGFSRIPVHGEESDEITGTLFTKDLMRAVRDGLDYMPVSSIARPPKYIPETKKVAELMAEMQAEKTHMAIVVDEYGTVVGLVTLEDLVEEVVGEISDEYDAEELPSVEQLSETDWSIDARLPIDEVFERTGIRLPHGDWDTVGGLLINAFGGVPVRGDSIEVDTYNITVEATLGRRVTRAKVECIASPEDEFDGDNAENAESSL